MMRFELSGDSVDRFHYKEKWLVCQKQACLVGNSVLISFHDSL